MAIWWAILPAILNQVLPRHHFIGRKENTQNATPNRFTTDRYTNKKVKISFTIKYDRPIIAIIGHNFFIGSKGLRR